MSKPRGGPPGGTGSRCRSGRVVSSKPGEEFFGVVGQQYDAVGVQAVQGVLGLRDRAVDVGQGKGGEQPEPVRIGTHEVGGVFVDLPRPLPGLVSSPRWTPGVDTDSTPVAMPWLSMNFSAAGRDQSGTSTPPGRMPFSRSQAA